MRFEIIKRSMIGISFGGIMTFIALTILQVKAIEVSVAEIWLHMLGSLVLGIYFGVASLIFDLEGWSPLKQTVYHFALSMLVFFPIAIGIGWIPFIPLALITGVALFTLCYISFWLGTKWYLKKLTDSMNNYVKK